MPEEEMELKPMPDEFADFPQAWQPTKPVQVIIDEAAGTAGVVRDHWKHRGEKGKADYLPGLESSKLKPGCDALIDELVARCRGASIEAVLALAGPTGGPLMARGQFIISEISGVLEYLYDDDVEDDHDRQYDQARGAWSDPTSIAAMALSLDGWAQFAETERARIDGLGEFDAKLIDEAGEIATKLRLLPEPGAQSPEVAAKFAARNRLLWALDRRVGDARKAGKWVFRTHPAIARQFASAWVRRNNAEQKRRAAMKKAPEAAATPE